MFKQINIKFTLPQLPKLSQYKYAIVKPKMHNPKITTSINHESLIHTDLQLSYTQLRADVETLNVFIEQEIEESNHIKDLDRIVPLKW